MSSDQQDLTREKADEAEARAGEKAARAEEGAREKAERAEEKARRAAERAAAKAEAAIEKTGRAQDRVSQAMDRAAEAEAQAAERARRAMERAERAARGEGADDDEAASVWLRPEPRSRKPSHTRAEIAAAALAIADAEGFDAVSMRRVAQQLGAGTMTLYHYVRNKDELVMLMFDAVMGEVLIPAEELRGGWRPALTRIATNTRDTFRRHRWTLDQIGDGSPGPNGMRHFEQCLAAVADLDLPTFEKFELIAQIDDYVFGFALREAEELREREGGWSEETVAFFQRELDSGDFPLIRELLGPDAATGIERVMEFFSSENRFESGLRRLLDGIEADVAPQGTKPRKGTKKSGK